MQPFFVDPNPLRVNFSCSQLILMLLLGVSALHIFKHIHGCNTKNIQPGPLHGSISNIISPRSTSSIVGLAVNLDYQLS